MEILAPAGSFESLRAAVYCDADAVYMGLQNFNARRQADNFNASSLQEAILLCRKNGVKVYITLNTLVFESEFEELKNAVKEMAEVGVDGVIVQDMGVVKLIKEAAPAIAIHASTQMSVHNLEGALAAAEYGIKRVVLARELSLREIRNISENCGIETEVFVHGALCFCVSGQCYLSAAIGARSGNRGLCAQPCRLPFYVNDSTRNGLSLKDMSHLAKLAQLQEAGVTSLKIEGRMKRPEYVAAAVRAVKGVLEGETDAQERVKTLGKVFSRSGFTDGYISGKTGREMFGSRTKDDAADPAFLKSIHPLYARQPKNVAITVKAELKEGAEFKVRVSDGAFESQVCGAVPEKAEGRGVSKEDVSVSLKKTGDTPFFVSELSVDCDDGLFITVGEMNGVRRAAQERLLEKRMHRERITFDGAVFENYGKSGKIRGDAYPGEMRKYGKFESAAQVTQRSAEMLDRIYLPAVELEKLPFKDKFKEKLGVILPRFAPDSEEYYKVLSKAGELGIKRAECRNIGAVFAAKKMGFEVCGGLGMNVSNSAAVDFWSDEGISEAELSFECSVKDMKKISGEIPLGFAGYGYLPLTISRNCPIKAEVGCRECGKKGVLKDRMGAEFKVICSDGYAEILNSVPLYLADRKMPEFDFVSLYFTVETADECEEIIKKYLEVKESKEKMTRGLYFRDVK